MGGATHHLSLYALLRGKENLYLYLDHLSLYKCNIVKTQKMSD